MDMTVKPAPRLAYNFFSKRKHRDVLAVTPMANTILNLLLIFFCILTLIPIYVIVISSVTSEAALTANGYRLWPAEFSGMAYRFLDRDDRVQKHDHFDHSRDYPLGDYGWVVCLPALQR